MCRLCCIVTLGCRWLRVCENSYLRGQPADHVGTAVSAYNTVFLIWALRGGSYTCDLCPLRRYVLPFHTIPLSAVFLLSVQIVTVLSLDIHIHLQCFKCSVPKLWLLITCLAISTGGYHFRVVGCLYNSGCILLHVRQDMLPPALHTTAFKLRTLILFIYSSKM